MVGMTFLSIVLIQAGAVSDAFQTFKKLQNLDRNTAGSAAVIGQLAAAAVENDPRAASDLGDNLEPLPSIAAETVSNLEAAGGSLSDPSHWNCDVRLLLSAVCGSCGSCVAFQYPVQRSVCWPDSLLVLHVERG